MKKQKKHEHPCQKTTASPRSAKYPPYLLILPQDTQDKSITKSPSTTRFQIRSEAASFRPASEAMLSTTLIVKPMPVGL